MFRTFADLTKLGITIFVVLSGLAGYALSFAIEVPFDINHLLYLTGGLFFLSSGSLALNQVQEFKKDKLMPRTAKRPIASGKIKPLAGLILACAFLLAGSELLLKASPLSCGLGWLTVILYNGLYTYWWKPKWVFAAIPGALPGALPVTIGYAANSPDIFSMDSVYLFLILFLWQMPHFWALALKFKDDYAKADVPTLPVAIGVQKTLYHMGLWTFLYAAVAVLAPWFVHASWIYALVVLPVVVKMMIDFFRLYKSEGQKSWFSFFMVVNLSVLLFLFVPVIDKWNFLFIKSN